MRELDSYDKHLLRLLQQNSRLTADELSAAVNLSASAVQRRLKKLREDKIIEAEIAIVNPEALGIGISCVVDIILQDGNSSAVEGFRSTMRKCPEVSHCYYVTGTYDFVIIVHVKDMRQYEEFSKKRLMDNPIVKHFYTHVVIDRVS
ncbi:MAG TPA: Lrp/AsnC family transcriptional regulator [Puia sp.]|nr:Lrp/AsnC family transcriptional regulator [Puia sp.]